MSNKKIILSNVNKLLINTNIIGIYYNIYLECKQKIINKFNGNKTTLRTIFYKLFSLYDNTFFFNEIKYMHIVKYNIIKYKYKKIYKIKNSTLYNKSNNNISIFKYVPLTKSGFFYIYDVIYPFISTKKKYNICEITTNPCAFEVFEYFKYYLNYNIENIDLFTSDISYMTFDNYLEYLDILKNVMKITTLQHNKTPLDGKYDLLTINLSENAYKDKPYIGESDFQYDKIVKQLSYLKCLKLNGNCLFYIHDIPNTKYVNIIYELNKLFKKTTLLYSSLRQFHKLNGGVYVYCEKYGRYTLTKKKEEDILQYIQEYNNELYLNKYKQVIDFERYITQHNLFNISINTILQISNVNAILFTINWCKTHNFEIFDIWNKYLHSGFGKEIVTYMTNKRTNHIYDMNNIYHLTTTASQLLDKLKKIDTSIHRKINTRNLNNYTKIKYYIRLYKNPDVKKSLYKYIEYKYKIPNVTQAWCKMYELFHILYYDYKLSLFNTSTLKTLHICEMPGNFISALYYFMQFNNIKCNWMWNAQSLVDAQIKDEYGYVKKYKDNWDLYNGGNLLDKNIQKYYIKKYKKTVSLITSDCGLCYESNENTALLDLHIIELNMILKILNVEGCFVAKKLMLFKQDKEFKILHKVYCNFEKILLIKLQINLYSTEFYIIGINKLKEPKTIQYNIFLGNIEYILTQMYEIHNFIIDMQLYFTDYKTNVMKDAGYLEKLIKNKNVEWCNDMKLKIPTTIF